MTKNAARRIAGFLEYLLMLIVILECNSMYTFTIETANYSDMSRLFYMLGLLVLVVTLALRLYARSAAIAVLWRNAPIYVGVLALAAAFYALNVSQQTEEARQEFIRNFLLFMPLLTMLFKVKQEDGKGFDLLFKYSDVICVFSALSLMVFVASAVNLNTMPSEPIYTRWSHLFRVHARINLLNVCQFFQGMKWQISGFSLLRNYGFYVEPLMFAIPLLTALSTELFLRPEWDRARIYRSLLLSATILSANATIAMMLLAVAWGLKGVQACASAGRRRLMLLLPLAVLLVCGLLFAEKYYRLAYRLAANPDSSIMDHVADIKAGLKAFLSKPLLGGGYQNENFIRGFMTAEKVKRNPGLSNTVAVVLGEGGAVLGLLCMLPYLIGLLGIFNKKSRRLARWCVVPLGLYVGVIFCYHLYLMLVAAFGYSLLELSEGRLPRRLALLDAEGQLPADPGPGRSRRRTRVAAGVIFALCAVLALFGEPFWQAAYKFMRSHQFSLAQSPLKAFCVDIMALFQGFCLCEALHRRLHWGRLAGLLAWNIAYVLAYPLVFSAVGTLLSIPGQWGERRESALLLAIYFAGALIVLHARPLRWPRRRTLSLAGGTLVMLALATVVSLHLLNGASSPEDALVPALESLTEYADGPVYVNELPLVYHRLNPGIHLSTTKDTGFDVLNAATVVYRADTDRRELLDQGFQVAKLTDDYLVYSNDPAVIEGLTPADGSWYRYYPFDKVANLEELAGQNDMEVGEDGTILIEGEERCLRHGPYYTVSAGRYTTRYELRIDSAEFDGVSPDISLCTVEVSYNYGEDVLIRKEVRLGEFDEDGVLVMEAPFSLYTIFDGVEFKVYGQESYQVQVREISYRQTPDYITVKTYNCHLDPLREAYFYVDGKPYLQPDGFAALEREYNAGDLVKSMRFLDGDGAPTLCAKGYAMVRYGYNSKRSRDYEAYFDVEGNPIASSAGFASVRTTYDAYGNPQIVRYFDAEGEPTRSTDGYAEVRREFDDRARVTRELYFDENGEPAMLYGGYSGLYREYDEDDNVTLLRYLDAEGNAAMNTSGYATCRQSYNTLGQLSRLAYFDDQDRPIALNVGYAACERDYNEFGAMIAERYYGEDGRPVRSASGVFMVRREFDSAGRMIRESYYDTDGSPIDSTAGYASLERSYNDRGKAAEDRLFGPDGQPAVVGVGYSRILYEYDEEGRLDLTRYLDDAGNPLEAGSGYMHDYLCALKGEDYTVFLAIQNEGTNALTEALRQDLRELGVRTDLTGRFRYSFYAVIAPDGVLEEVAYDRALSRSGEVGQNGIPYSIASAGYEVGNYCSIQIGGVEYARKARGMNFVVFDNATQTVVDAVTFDTYTQVMTVTR